MENCDNLSRSKFRFTKIQFKPEPNIFRVMKNIEVTIFHKQY